MRYFDRPHRRLIRFWPILLWLMVAAIGGIFLWFQGNKYVDVSRRHSPKPVTGVERIPFEVPNAVELSYKIGVRLEKGIVTVKILDADGNTIVDTSGSVFTLAGPRSNEKYLPGTYLVEVHAQQAVGLWEVAVFDKGYYILAVDSKRLITGKLMALVGVLSMSIWGWAFRPGWRYFLVGGFIWAIGVGLKVAFALLLNAPVLSWFGEALPGGVAVALSVVYIGLLTGVFEIGVTAFAAGCWSRLSLNAARGVAVGIGAGATEAIALGIFVSLSAAFGPAVQSVAGFSGITLSENMVPVIERILALFCHVGSRSLVLFAVATRRWRWALCGFALLSIVDAIAAYWLFRNVTDTLSPWFLELSILPLALLSIAAVFIMVKYWPYRQVVANRCVRSDEFSKLP